MPFAHDRRQAWGGGEGEWSGCPPRARARACTYTPSDLGPSHPLVLRWGPCVVRTSEPSHPPRCGGCGLRTRHTHLTRGAETYAEPAIQCTNHSSTRRANGDRSSGRTCTAARGRVLRGAVCFTVWSGCTLEWELRGALASGSGRSICEISGVVTTVAGDIWTCSGYSFLGLSRRRR